MSVLFLALVASSYAACGDNLGLNLEVTGAFGKSNGTVYTVRTNEYATFTCAAQALVKVQSKLTVDCVGSSKKTFSKEGAGSAEAKYQTNDDCIFNSKCTITCSAESDCDKKETQEYTLIKSNVGIIDSSNVNCTKDINTNKLCTNSSYQVHVVQRSEPYGLGGKLTGESECEVGQHFNTSTINIFYVLPPVNKCSCHTTFKFWEMNSQSVLCPDPVYTKVIETRVEQYCDGAGVSVGTIIGILLFLVFLVLVFLVVVGWLDHKGYLEPLHKWRRAPIGSPEDFLGFMTRNFSRASDTVQETVEEVPETVKSVPGRVRSVFTNETDTEKGAKK